MKNELLLLSVKVERMRDMEKMSELTPLEELQIAADDIEERERKYLCSMGWEYTCDTPGSAWMYQKDLEDGRTLLVSHSTAVGFQDYWDIVNNTDRKPSWGK